MNVLVCVKRVPATSGKISLTPDEQEIDVRFLGFTVSPHEECAVEEAVRLVEAHGGTSAVLTLGPEPAVEQLHDAMSMGIDRAMHLVTDGREWDPVGSAHAIVDAVHEQQTAGVKFDLFLFGNEAADSGDYQVGIRVAHALGLPCVTGAKGIEVREGTVIVRREGPAGWELFEVALPAVIAVKEGINLPRYPSIPGRIKAKRKPIERTIPKWTEGGLRKTRLKLPKEQGKAVKVLGEGTDAVPQVLKVLQMLGVVRP
jgi:electron transfer flavoprotein beta subunit